MTLQELYIKHKKGDWPDKGSVHSYIEVYEEILKPYRHTAKNILEIGLMSGESLRMWDEYFDGKVFGIDCDVKPINGLADLTRAIADGLNITIGDATDPAVIAEWFKGKFDVVIEDANHDRSQQFNIYETLKPYIAEGGIYIIEDIQNIDLEKDMFEHIDIEKQVTIIDRRKVKNRYDDVLVIIKN